MFNWIGLYRCYKTIFQKNLYFYLESKKNMRIKNYFPNYINNYLINKNNLLCKNDSEKENKFSGFNGLISFDSNNDVINSNKREIFERIMNDSHVVDLNKNILLSKYDGEDLLHLELTEDTIRMEYKDHYSEEYRKQVQIMDLEEEELLKYGIHECFVPVKVENNTSIGAGCTVHLSRSKISKYLKNNIKLLSFDKQPKNKK
eukprot:TRINITY_DN13091_c0_g1_i1.p1 TRINITY_DN13091_c0_g1~~TRINITY_DN13091_c0_g1_i1.p1  ORF type:complete len:202 (+),score=22.63 TRINITY_DN13091_c0_g1_i1:122-727(+)